MEDSPVAYVGSSDTEERKERGGQIKTMDKVTDLESTGRKRAAKYYPISEGMACEWKGLRAAGGGPNPIIGCIAGVAANIHHGPDKNTLSNYVGNVHRICSTCHNRWHTENDKYYSKVRPSGDTPYLPEIPYAHTKHNGLLEATPKELAESELDWALRKKRK